MGENFDFFLNVFSYPGPTGSTAPHMGSYACVELFGTQVDGLEYR